MTTCILQNSVGLEYVNRTICHVERFKMVVVLFLNVARELRNGK